MVATAPAPEADPSRAHHAERPSDQAGLVWAAWLPVAWILPPALLLARFTGGGGWETLFFLIGSPIWIPAVALLGALPRFIMRRRGFRSAPWAVGGLMVASAWGFALFMLAMRGSGDSGTINSLMWDAVGQSERAEGVLSGVGFILWPAAYLVALVLACVLPVGSGKRGRTLIPALVCIATPLIAGLITASIVASMHRGPVDGGGDQEVDVIGVSQQERVAKQEAYWDRAQGAVSPLRDAIRADGWLVGPSSGVLATGQDEPEQYGIVVAWEQRFEEEPVAVGERAVVAALAAGWERADDEPDGLRHTEEDGTVISLTSVLRNAEGYTLTIIADLPAGMREARAEGKLSGPPTASYLRLRVESPSYFAGDEPVDWYGIASSDDPATQELWSDEPRTFTAFEWPELAAVEGGWSIDYAR